MPKKLVRLAESMLRPDLGYRHILVYAELLREEDFRAQCPEASFVTTAFYESRRLADTCAAWNALPKEKQKKIDNLIIHHSYGNLAAAMNRPLTDEEKRDFPDVRHPMVRRHPRDGRPAIWGLSTRTPKEVLGMPKDDGLALIKELIDYVTEDRFVYRHKWQVGDVLAWDNRCTMHTGTPFDRSRYIRVVHRTWVEGEVPVGI